MQQFPSCVSVRIKIIGILLGPFPLCFKTGSLALPTWYIHDTSMLIPGKEGKLQGSAAQYFSLNTWARNSKRLYETNDSSRSNYTSACFGKGEAHQQKCQKGWITFQTTVLLSCCNSHWPGSCSATDKWHATSAACLHIHSTFRNQFHKLVIEPGVSLQCLQ